MQKNKNIYLYFIVLVLVLLLIPAFRGAVAGAVFNVSKPLTEKISNYAHRSHGFISGIYEISSIRDENKQLTQKLKELQVDETQLNELKHENEVLKNQLGFLDLHKETNLIPARIIGREPFGVLDRITIDRGESDGVKNNAAVVSDGALIGKVSEVSNNQAKIILVTSKNSIIQAMLQDSRTLGIVKGSLGGVKLENIPQDTKVNDREAVVTSGLGGEIAPGILIGWARGDVTSKSEIYKTINLDLAEDINKLELVFVVK